MSDLALYLGAGALLCAVYSLLGGGLARRWGVDVSRDAPGTLKRGTERRLIVRQTLGLAAALPPALWMSAAVGQVMGWKVGMAVCAAGALLCAMLGFAALFASVRHEGEGAARVCAEGLFPAAGRIRQALGALSATMAAGAMLMSLLQDGRADVTNGMLYAFSCALWPMLSMSVASERLAPVIRSERQMTGAAAVSAVGAGLLAMLALTPSAAVLTGGLTVLLVRLLWLASWAVLLGQGDRALRALLERPMMQKPRRLWPCTLLCAAVSVLLAGLGGTRVFTLATVLCALTVALDVAGCMGWLERIGRGLFR